MKTAKSMGTNLHLKCSDIACVKPMVFLNLIWDKLTEFLLVNFSSVEKSSIAAESDLILTKLSKKWDGFYSFRLNLDNRYFITPAIVKPNPRKNGKPVMISMNTDKFSLINECASYSCV